ncbi:MAG: polysaccharide deacetylase family protein [Chitinivibrionales bacterium]|nr:polysaccharide deacetylase family protein [Chitinivibrionales bacterium]
MELSILTKRFVSALLVSTKIIANKFNLLKANSSGILIYHRVAILDSDIGFIQPGLYVTPDTFKMHIEVLKSIVNIVPLNLVPTLTASGNANHFEKPLVALTFDDGWADIFSNAYPVLKSLNIPATVFLPTNFIGTDRWFWTDRFAYLWEQKGDKSRVSLNPVIKKLKALKGPFITQIENGVALLKDFPLMEIDKILLELEAVYDVPSQIPGRAFLNWQEVKEMHESGLISFGSHTAEHSILTTLNEDEIKKELKLSRQRLIDEGVVDGSNIPFCYPNGNYTATIAQMAKETGYTMAVTTKKGWNDFGADPFTLKRIGMHQDMTSTKSMFLARIAGIL